MFQFTRPAWGATSRPPPPAPIAYSFNSRAPRGARRWWRAGAGWASGFQFTRPAWGATGMARVYAGLKAEFQFTRPAWGATHRSPVFICNHQFQFTRPAWGATLHPRRNSARREFQFTRPAWGATTQNQRTGTPFEFQFTRPAWGATFAASEEYYEEDVSIHAPRMGRDLRSPRTHIRVPVFQFTRPAWGATVGTVTPSLATRKANDSAYPAEIKGCSVVKERSTRVTCCTTASCEVREPL